ncbi:MAG: 3-hydroxyacyl-CoA dehydrogenase NAD-binding domain-containing protein [Pseudomonadota bacterium]
MPEVVATELADGIAWVTIDNPPVNATSAAVRAGLLDALDKVQGCELAVLRAAGKTFVAGGDVSEFDAPPAPPHLPDVVDAVERSGTPVLAFLHGTVLGGGFELAMAAAFRVARPGTQFGLPEVNLGLIPGAGGTQRAPRLLGWGLAVEMACHGQLKPAEALLAVGAIDAMACTPEEAVAAVRGRRPSRVSERSLTPLEPAAERAFRTHVADAAKGRQAPLHALTAMTWAVEPYGAAQPRERALHLELRQSAESVALRHVFFAERAVAKPAVLHDASPRPIERIAVIGGGHMGSAIAATCLLAGARVALIERDAEAASVAADAVAQVLDGAVTRGKLTAGERVTRLNALSASADLESATGADLAIEAVIEDLDTKRQLFQSLAPLLSPGALLATNTSYLDPNAIFEGIPSPERCLGLHFFSPAHIMKLTEIVRAARTSPDTLATAFAFARRLRKTPVLSGVCDGFIGNRMLAAYRRAAEYMLADGALPHEVDAALRAFGMAMGPFETQDHSGHQIAFAARRRQDATRDPRERYVAIADQLCALERFGKRSGAGWYAYPAGARRGQPDPDVEALIRAWSEDHGITRRSFRDDEIQTLLLAALANEGARIVEEGIAESEAAVDVVKIAGYGFPRWRGGPMHWAETIGRDAMMDALGALEAASPGSWIRAARYKVPPG